MVSGQIITHNVDCEQLKDLLLSSVRRSTPHQSPVLFLINTVRVVTTTAPIFNDDDHSLLGYARRDCSRSDCDYTACGRNAS